MKHGEHGPGHHGRHGHGHRDHQHPGAQTFRRGRVLDFLQQLNVKQATLVHQLQQTELQAIHPVLSGELKAVELIRNEFIALFELHEGDEGPTENDRGPVEDHDTEDELLAGEPDE